MSPLSRSLFLSLVFHISQGSAVESVIGSNFTEAQENQNQLKAILQQINFEFIISMWEGAGCFKLRLKCFIRKKNP